MVMVKATLVESAKGEAQGFQSWKGPGRESLSLQRQREEAESRRRTTWGSIIRKGSQLGLQPGTPNSRVLLPDLFIHLCHRVMTGAEACSKLTLETQT